MKLNNCISLLLSLLLTMMWLMNTLRFCEHEIICFANKICDRAHVKYRFALEPLSEPDDVLYDISQPAVLLVFVVEMIFFNSYLLFLRMLFIYILCSTLYRTHYYTIQEQKTTKDL